MKRRGDSRPRLPTNFKTKEPRKGKVAVDYQKILRRFTVEELLQLDEQRDQAMIDAMSGDSIFTTNPKFKTVFETFFDHARGEPTQLNAQLQRSVQAELKSRTRSRRVCDFVSQKAGEELQKANSALEIELSAARRRVCEAATSAFFLVLCEDVWPRWESAKRERESHEDRRLGVIEEKRLVLDVLDSYSRRQMEAAFVTLERPFGQMLGIVKRHHAERPAVYSNDTEWAHALTQDAVQNLIPKELEVFRPWLVEPNGSLSKYDPLSKFGLPPYSEGAYCEMAWQLAAPFETALREKLQRLADDDLLGPEEQRPRVLPVLSESVPKAGPETTPKAAERVEESMFTHSDSYQQIHFRGKDYDLTSHRRAAAVVRVLDEARQRGELRVTAEVIRAGIGLKHGGKMYDWFRRTGLWKHLVIVVERGVYRLDIPSPKKR